MKLSSATVLLAALHAPAWCHAVTTRGDTVQRGDEAAMAAERAAMAAASREALDESSGGRKLQAGSPVYVAQSDATILANTLLDPANGAVLTGTPTLGGDSRCSALFSNGAVIGVDNGVVLSTGIATDLAGPNVASFLSTDFGTAGSTDLDALLPFQASNLMTRDVCRLDFEFTCPAGFSPKPITGKYVFGGDEYNIRPVENDPATIGVAYDITAVFVNGVNLATFDGFPIDVFDVSCGFSGNDTGAFGCEIFNNNILGQTGGMNETAVSGPFNTEYNGFTNVLPLQFTPSTGATANTVSIQIGDEFDGTGDSAIHLLSGSFGCCSDNVGVCGDPHFITWHGEKYDYHGKCDLELLSDPSFANGKGLDVHVRTEIIRQWSYIKSAAIRIGDDILEVGGGAKEQAYWVNKEYQGELTTIGGFPVTYYKANSKAHVYTIHMEGGNDDVIEIRTYKDFVRVDFKKPTKAMYGNTVGLLGNFETGEKLGRDGKTVFTDNFNEFGQEWQVRPHAPALFHNFEGPQSRHLEKCMMPSEFHAKEKRGRKHRRLGENLVTKFEAEVACHAAGISNSDHDMCVADVLAADDLDMANIYVEDSGAAGSH